MGPLQQQASGCSKRAFRWLLDCQPAGLNLHHLQLRGSDMLAHGPHTPARPAATQKHKLHGAHSQHTHGHDTEEGMARVAHTGQQLHEQRTCLFSYSISTNGSPLTLQQQRAARALVQQTVAPQPPRRRSSSRGCVRTHATWCQQPAAPSWQHAVQAYPTSTAMAGSAATDAPHARLDLAVWVGLLRQQGREQHRQDHWHACAGCRTCTR